MTNQQPHQQPVQSKPLATFRDRGGLKATVWQHQGKSGKPFYPVNLTRSYKDDGGNWQETNRFVGDELLRIARLAGQAYDFVNQFQQEQATSGGSQ